MEDSDLRAAAVETVWLLLSTLSHEHIPDTAWLLYKMEEHSLFQSLSTLPQLSPQ
jgi:hypothetical protein